VLLNAAQAIFQGGGRGIITIEVGADAEAVEVAISDSGPGVPEGERERVFEPFYSTRGATGLGLTVSRQIVERHRGTILVDGAQAAARGAAVRIRVPRGA
jgi:signal transduction histidine kinase